LVTIVAVIRSWFAHTFCVTLAIYRCYSMRTIKVMKTSP
jgi:hypothetical protein